MEASETFYLYKARHGEGEPYYQKVGKFLLNDSEFKVLEDNDGLLESIEKKEPDEIAAVLHSLTKSTYFKVVNIEDLKQGHYPELIKELEGQPTPKPESSFEYHRVGMPAPQNLEFVQGKAFLDGHPLSDDEVKLLHENAQAGHASVKYKEKTIKKSLISVFKELAKAESASFDEESNKDSTFPEMGNRHSHKEFLKIPTKGIHIRVDVNHLGKINDAHGHKTGDKALQAVGKVLSAAMSESAGKEGKLFRIKGDVFAGHVPSQEHAAQLSRNLRAKLEEIPPVNGTHNLSVCVGLGHTTDHAHSALSNAKKEKVQANYPEGQAKQHVYSLILGSEGAIPQDEEKGSL